MRSKKSSKIFANIGFLICKMTGSNSWSQRGHWKNNLSCKKPNTCNNFILMQFVLDESELHDLLMTFFLDKLDTRLNIVFLNLLPRTNVVNEQLTCSLILSALKANKTWEKLLLKGNEPKMYLLLRLLLDKQLASQVLNKNTTCCLVIKHRHSLLS